jgi:hypothetical protein
MCTESAHGVTCGAKIDDVGAADEEQGRGKVSSWRLSVLRKCYEAGHLAVIGGGGGGGGGAECCKAVPTLNLGFGFMAELKPSVAGPGPALLALHIAPHSGDCCPDLSRWNITKRGESSSGSSFKIGAARRLAAMPTAARSAQSAAGLAQKGSDPGGDHEFLRAADGMRQRAFSPDNVSDNIDPFAREHGKTGQGANRRPTLKEMIKQHAERLSVLNGGSKMLSWVQAPTCKMPAWLREAANSTEPTASGKKKGHRWAQTREPPEALKYILQFNPLQGFLAEGAESCEGGWGEWCCVCHHAQRRIACQADAERSKLEWFLTEDCCESKMKKNASSAHAVIDLTPLRNMSIIWSPELGGWTEVFNASDSYAWDPVHTSSAIHQQECRMVDIATGSAHETQPEEAHGLLWRSERGGVMPLPSAASSGAATVEASALPPEEQSAIFCLLALAMLATYAMLSFRKHWHSRSSARAAMPKELSKYLQHELEPVRTSDIDISPYHRLASLD